MNYATIKYFDVANGPGIRTSLFVSGCTHCCKGCFNSVAWDFSYGQEFTKEVEDIIIDSLKLDYVKGLTLLGGEPFEISNQKGLVRFVERVKELYPNKSIWAFSGYLFEDILPGGKVHCDESMRILNCLDVLVDGEYKEELKNLMLKFKGSENQRTIDVQESLKQNSVVLKKL